MATKRYIAITETLPFDEVHFADAADSNSSETNTLVVPTFTTGRRYIGIAVPASGEDITAFATGGFTVTNAFERASVNVYIDGVEHKVWTSRGDQNTNVSGDSYTITYTPPNPGPAPVNTTPTRRRLNIAPALTQPAPLKTTCSMSNCRQHPA